MEKKLINSFINSSMLQRDIDALWPGCSLIFNRRLLTVIDNEVNRNTTENLIYYYHPDHLGSSNTLTDITGLPFQHMEYMPFGETFVEENIGSYSTPYRFTSKELDDETRLYYYGARYYDPKLSMFLGVDPLSSSFPALSGYAYCYNNPTNFIDRWGLFGDEVKAQKAQKRAIKKYGIDRVGDVYKNGTDFKFQIFKKGSDKNTHIQSDGTVMAYRPDAVISDNRSLRKYEGRGNYSSAKISALGFGFEITAFTHSINMGYYNKGNQAALIITFGAGPSNNFGYSTYMATVTSPDQNFQLKQLKGKGVESTFGVGPFSTSESSNSYNEPKYFINQWGYGAGYFKYSGSVQTTHTFMLPASPVLFYSFSILY